MAVPSPPGEVKIVSPVSILDTQIKCFFFTLRYICHSRTTRETTRSYSKAVHNYFEHESVCYSFVTRPYKCIQIVKQFQSPWCSLPSKRFRMNSTFLLSPDSLDELARKRLPPARSADYKVSEIQDVFYYSVKPSKHVKKLYLIC